MGLKMLETAETGDSSSWEGEMPVSDLLRLSFTDFASIFPLNPSSARFLFHNYKHKPTAG